MKEDTFFPLLCGLLTGAILISFTTSTCAANTDPNERFTNPPIHKVVIRKDRDTKQLDKFIKVDEQVMVPVDGKGFSTNQEDTFDYGN